MLGIEESDNADLQIEEERDAGSIEGKLEGRLHGRRAG
jgi:hypothetical protein